MNTNSIPTTAPAVSTEITDVATQLVGFHPALDRAVTALVDLLEAGLTTDQSMCVVAALGGAEDSLSRLLGLVLRQIANPDTNPALADLPTGPKQALRRLGAEYAAGIDDDYLRQSAAEVCAVIEGV